MEVERLRDKGIIYLDVDPHTRDRYLVNTMTFERVQVNTIDVDIDFDSEGFAYIFLSDTPEGLPSWVSDIMQRVVYETNETDPKDRKLHLLTTVLGGTDQVQSQLEDDLYYYANFNAKIHFDATGSSVTHEVGVSEIPVGGVRVYFRASQLLDVLAPNRDTNTNGTRWIHKRMKTFENLFLRMKFPVGILRSLEVSAGTNLKRRIYPFPAFNLYGMLAVLGRSAFTSQSFVEDVLRDGAARYVKSLLQCFRGRSMTLKFFMDSGTTWDPPHGMSGCNPLSVSVLGGSVDLKAFIDYFYEFPEDAVGDARALSMKMHNTCKSWHMAGACPDATSLYDFFEMLAWASDDDKDLLPIYAQLCMNIGYDMDLILAPPTVACDDVESQTTSFKD